MALCFCAFSCILYQAYQLDQIRSYRNSYFREAERTKLLIATEKQKVIEKEAETERKRAIIEAQKQAEVANITYSQRIMEKDSQRKMSVIEGNFILAELQ